MIKNRTQVFEMIYWRFGFRSKITEQIVKCMIESKVMKQKLAKKVCVIDNQPFLEHLYSKKHYLK